ncbi:MAG TPA: hypothetical protein VGV06_12350, partial [Methylomirabilota bacterium]|nr:hypothetical protein [Methylomirabilota bacterium]
MEALGALLSLALICALFIGVPVLIYRVRQHQRAADEAQRQASRAAHEQEQTERAREEILEDLDRYFPFLREPFRAGVQEGKKPEEAFWDAVSG